MTYMDTDHTPTTRHTDHADTGKVNHDTGDITMAETKAENDSTTASGVGIRVTSISASWVGPYRFVNGTQLTYPYSNITGSILNTEAVRIIESWNGSYIRPEGFNDPTETDETDGAE